MTFFQFIFQKNVPDENKGFYEMLANRIRGRFFLKLKEECFIMLHVFTIKNHNVSRRIRK